jgi:hypothetical protein
MRVKAEEDFRLTVLNPGGRDPQQQFHRVPAPAVRGHAPINFHAFAACTLGAFHCDARSAIAEGTPVLLLLRSDFRGSERAFADLKTQGRSIAVSLKETGLHQIAEQLRDPRKLSRFIKTVGEADGCIATTPEAAEIYRSVRSRRDPSTVEFIPTPYPIGDQQWNFSVSRAEQSGIFVGTREWNVPSRNHLAALLAARQLCAATSEPITVVNVDGNRGKRLLGTLNFPERKLNLIEQWESYPDYLRSVARHKIVLQFDSSHVPGQVAGDALLCRIPCIGGNGAIDRIAFPKSCGEGRTTSEIVSTALNLLKNPDLRETIVRESQAHARERLSFEAVRSQLAKFFTRLPATRTP